MRIFVVLMLIVLVGCVDGSGGVREREVRGEMKIKIHCKSPFGHVETYEWLPSNGYEEPWRWQSGMWSFEGYNLKGEVVKVSSTFCHMEEVRGRD